MLRVGLTGGIGSGKSEVSRRLAAHGAVLVDADVAAREVVEPGTPGLGEIVAVFGPAVLRPDGSLDRERLGQIVFADPDLRAKLNAIVHPLVHERMRQVEQEGVRSAGPDAIVVHDIPLLAESGLAAGYDVVVVVDAPESLQIERLAASRGMSATHARERMSAQASREQRLAVAGIVIDNSGSLEELDRRVDGVWADLRQRVTPGGAGCPEASARTEGNDLVTHRLFPAEMAELDRFWKEACLLGLDGLLLNGNAPIAADIHICLVSGYG